MSGGVEATVIPRKYVKVQSTQPTSAVQGDLWVDTDDNALYQYTGSTWQTVTQDVGYLNMQQLQQAIAILALQANASLTPADYDTMFLDKFTDNTGYDNTVDTGNTTASFLTNVYNNGGALTGLTGYWKFNESSGNASDSSGNSNTLTNTSVTYGAGKISNCAVFNGSAKFNCSGTNFAMGTGAFTFAFWIKSSDTGTYKPIISIGVVDNSATSMKIETHSSKLRLTDLNNTAYVTSNTSICDGNWHHCVITRDGSNNMKLYLDGNTTPDATGTCSNDFSDSSNFNISFNGLSAYGTHSIDNLIAIKGTAWGTSDVSTNYNSGSGTEGGATANCVVQTNTITLDADASSYLLFANTATAGTGSVQFKLSFDDGSVVNS